jgi:proline iminopeptidase
MKNLFLMLVATALASVTFTSCEIVDPNEPGLLVPRTVDEDPSVPSIFVNGTQLHSETFGNPNDPMIVVLHGGPGGDYRCILNCSKFSEDSFFVVFYDQRGSGLSKRHSKESYHDVQIFIDDLDAVIKYYQKSGQKVFLMGHSWGAMLATAYVNQYPSKVNGVVMMEPGGFTWHDTEEFITRQRPDGMFSETVNDFLYFDQLITASDHKLLDYKAQLQVAGAFAEGNRLGDPGPTPFCRSGAVCKTAALETAEAHPFDFTTGESLDLSLRLGGTKAQFSDENAVYRTIFRWEEV